MRLQPTLTGDKLQTFVHSFSAGMCSVFVVDLSLRKNKLLSFAFRFESEILAPINEPTHVFEGKICVCSCGEAITRR